MTASPAELYDRILAFPIDEGTPDLPFEARLARENGWTLAYARRAIVEYKRFIYLAMTTGYTVCPSEDVDQAWHMHLTYTRSYWDRLCGQVLGRPIHHGPTRGGSEESAKFRDLYVRTKTAYQAAFGEPPPTDIWPSVKKRFGADLHFVRVNSAQNWVIPKYAVRRALLLLVLGGAAMIGATGCVGPNANPFALVGTDFVLLLIPLLVTAFVAGWIFRHFLRGPDPQPGDEGAELDWADAAYLAGGRHRLATATLARLVAAGLARVSPDGRMIEAAETVGDLRRLTPVETAARQTLPLSREGTEGRLVVARAVEYAFAERALELQDSGYRLSASRAFASAVAAILPMSAVVLLLGLPRLITGIEHGKPVGILFFTLLAAALVMLLAFFSSLVRLSHRGHSVLKQRRRDCGKQFIHEAAPESIGWSVALFGTTALVSCGMAELAALGAWFPCPSSSSSGGCGTGCAASGGGDGGGGGCGGGCGGGGCGGCGG